MNELYEYTIDKENFIVKDRAFIRRSIYLKIKRLFDILFGILGIIALVPVTIIILIVNFLNKDYSSIFYTHNRIGKNGKEFKLYKFRSMVPNADEVLKKLLKQKKYKKEWAENQKLENDPRITKIGKILRQTSLDELPQFINVLRGDMSLIGPRPLIKGELDEHNGNHDIYESVKPGITGWWACNGRSATTYEKRLELEYYYVKNISLLLDIKCIVLTIKAVISRSGAE